MTATTHAASTAASATPLDRYMRASVVSTFVVQAVLFGLFAALATSRAAGNLLSAPTLAGILAGAAFAGAFVAWPAGIYGGAYDRLDGRVDEATAPPVSPSGVHDPFARLWWVAGGWALVSAAWVAAGAGLVAVALDGRRAGGLVVAATMVGLVAVATTAVDAAARRGGAVAPVATGPTPVRTRAWRELAMPLAASQAFVNAGVAWVLFRDYTSGDRFTSHALTDQVAFADLGVIVVLLTAVFGFLGRRWGAVDAARGRVTTETVHSGPALGWQGLVYVAAAALIAGRLLVIALPPEPSLGVVIVARGLFSGVLVLVVVAAAYTRGAINHLTAGAPR